LIAVAPPGAVLEIKGGLWMAEKSGRVGNLWIDLFAARV
jgi:hypothetical protein